MTELLLCLQVGLAVVVVVYADAVYGTSWRAWCGHSDTHEGPAEEAASPSLTQEIAEMFKQSLPHRSTPTQMDTPQRHDRRPIYQGIARLIWAQYCLEQNISYEGFDHAPQTFRAELLDVAECMANMALEPDRKDAALMCMAERILEGNTGGDLTFRHVSKHTASSYLTTAESALTVFFLNLKDVPPDGRYREEMARLIDTIAPKKGVM